MFQKILKGLFVITVLFSVHVISAEAAATSSVPSTTVTSSRATSTSLQTPAEIEKRVSEYFTDVPVMIEIAKCESKFRQYTDAGNVLRGGGSGGMIGIFQFYELIHKAPALALGFDIETVEGNIAYARHIYEQEGTRPWASCVPAVIPAVQTMSPADKELQITLLTKVVELLQELLKLELAKR
jgi:hypothetical protein